MPTTPNWDEYFIDLATAIARKSKDTTAVGCVIVGPDNEMRSCGWNGFSRGVKDLEERMVRPDKYDWTIHAEANAVANAARVGISLNECRAYVTHFCCSSCADMLIQSGICEVVVGGGQTVSDHKQDLASIKFEEAGVKVRKI